jgi:hypothetical protein
VGEKHGILVVGEYRYLVIVGASQADLTYHDRVLTLLPAQHGRDGRGDVVVQHPEHSGSRRICARDLHIGG